MSFPLSDLPDQNPYGWIVAGIVTLLSAVGGFWAIIRQVRKEDSTTALTHANRIIASHERYAKRRDERIVELEDQIRKLWKAIGDTTEREQRCLVRVEWLVGILRDNDIEVPDFRPDEPKGVE